MTRLAGLQRLLLAGSRPWVKNRPRPPPEADRAKSHDMLIALADLPGTGKTTIARLLAHRLPAAHVRIGTIEQALLRAGFTALSGPEGYLVAYGVAADNLRLDHHVIADCVNAVQVSRDAWEKVAVECQVGYLAVHLACSDADDHRRRVSERRGDIQSHVLPTWEQVSASRFDPPAPGVLLIDTCACSAEGAIEQIMRRLGGGLLLTHRWWNTNCGARKVFSSCFGRVAC
jgi:predicted kinase